MLMREIYQHIEIDIDYCDLTYGTAPCAAVLGTTGQRKCFNTAKTCQDIDNFAKGVKVIKFGLSVTGAPRGVFPLLQSVSIRSSTVNISGYDTSIKGIGVRGTISARLKDAAYHDREFDKYHAGRVDGTAQLDEGPYNPETRGTLFGKLKNRFPYYAGRPMRVIDSYLDGGILTIDKTRHYIITDINGPDEKGNVEIKGKDILDLVDNTRAVVPVITSGVLAADLAINATEFNIDPVGIGDADYAASGWVSIGSELIKFTRSGDTMTVVERGASGTTIRAGSLGDSVQQSYSVRRRRIDLVLRDILEIAGIDAAFIPVAKWTAECDRWANDLQLTADITKSEGANGLINEMLLLGVSVWWDDVLQEIGLKVNRPPDEDVVFEFNDNDNIKAVKQIDKDDKRLTEAAFFSVPIDPTKVGKNGSNYTRQTYVVDQDAKSELQYDDTRLRKVYIRWLNHGNNALIRIISKRLINRFRDTPVVFDITVDASSDIGLTDVISLTSRIYQDDTGKPIPKLMQATALKEGKTGHELIVTAQSYQFDGRYGLIADNARSSYTLSSDAERVKGVYFVDDTLLKFGDGTKPYVFI